jgi:hypothetical protein
MYTFKTGEFAGRTMEHVMLRSAPKLYRKAIWAKEKAPDMPLAPPALARIQKAPAIVVARSGKGWLEDSNLVSKYWNWLGTKTTQVSTSTDSNLFFLTSTSPRGC